MPKYIHYPLNEEIRSIGGYYKTLEEGTLSFEGKKVLYALRAAHVDTSCCGSGGVGFIAVPGYIVSWKSETDESGNPVSEVKRIRDSSEQKLIKQELLKKYPFVSIVDFG